MKVILNEQHKLLPEQENLLNKRFEENWEIFSVPAKGWDRKEIKNIADRLKGNGGVVFASPVPLLIGLLADYNGYLEGVESLGGFTPLYIFFNSHREKKELPNGKVIFTIPQKGWELVQF